MKHMKADLVEFPSFILKLNTKNKTFLQTCLANTISKMMIKYVHLISSILYRYIYFMGKLLLQQPNTKYIENVANCASYISDMSTIFLPKG